MKLSDLARPPIQSHETVGVQHAVCPYHNGLIAHVYSSRDEGKAFWCPVGRMFYRFTSKWQGGSSAPLPYNHERPV